jgi:type IV secretion system protein VirD4
MKNYAGHRLSPWLGHLMVSRQETARPLLTPGEVMQLPPEDELVLVSGVPPIRAKKARYFEDRRLAERVLPPPDIRAFGREGGGTMDDWSRLPSPLNANASKPQAGLGIRPSVDDSANSGIRREPELPEHEDIATEASRPPPEFDFTEDEGDGDAIRARVLRTIIPGLARQAAMDPDDGLEL